MPRPELPGRRLLILAAAMAGTLLAALALVLLWLHARQLPPGGAGLQRPYVLVMPGPVLQSAPQADLKAYFADKSRRLHGRGWVDGSQQLAHIPIDDAMTLLAASKASAPKASEEAAP